MNPYDSFAGKYAISGSHTRLPSRLRKGARKLKLKLCLPRENIYIERAFVRDIPRNFRTICASAENARRIRVFFFFRARQSFFSGAKEDVSGL